MSFVGTTADDTATKVQTIYTHQQTATANKQERMQKRRISTARHDTFKINKASIEFDCMQLNGGDALCLSVSFRTNFREAFRSVYINVRVFFMMSLG